MTARGRREHGVRSLRRHGQRGSAIAEFAMVGALVVVLFMAAIQLGIALFVRNTLIAHASEGARYGARADSTPAQGAQRTRDLVATSLSNRFAQDVTAQRATVDGVPVVEVRIRAPLPVLGLLGPSGELSVTGRAYAEGE